MKTKVVVIISIIAFSLFLITYQSSEAATYVGHDGSVGKYLTKKTVEPIKGKNNIWTYIVSVCADSHPIAVAGVVLKSDMEQQVLGVNKNIKAGQCSYFGAVMKAKDGKTLGAELIEKSESTSRMIQIIKDSSTMSKSQRSAAMKELIQLSYMTGIAPPRL